MGLDDLRDCIAAYVAEDGVTCSRENILVTNGYKHATELALRDFTEVGDRIIVSAPTYMTTLQTFQNCGLNLLGVPQDGEGLDADQLETRLRTLRDTGEPSPKLLFDIPDFHNPIGITMSLEPRKRLIELALEYEFVIVEDDPYRRLALKASRYRPLSQSMRRASSSLSKILSPGLRVGWAIAAPEIVKRMALQKSDGGSSPFNQRIVASLMRSNKIGLHIAEISQHMKVHRDAMIDALATALPGATVRKPDISCG